MTDWTDGYVSDIEYTTGFYRELAPLFLGYAAALNGAHAPDPGQPFTYCELACGQGFGTNLLAAVHPHARFYGIDFNPAQIANARGLAEEAGLDNVTFREDSFEEAVALPDEVLPACDFITLHGIYAWISEENRRHIARFIRRKLKPGGLVYVSYNCMPGWAQMAPFQRLVREHANLNPDRSDRQMEAALAFMESLKTAEARYFAQNPVVGTRMKGLADKDRHYLAHEYLNSHWHPLYHTDVARELSEAKLSYLASASLLENFEVLSLPPKVRDIQADIKDPGLRELIKDYAVNQQFRRDVFVKGRRNLSSVAARATLQELSFLPLKTREQMSFKFQTVLGEANGQEEIYGPVRDGLAEGTRRLGDLAARVGDLGRASQALAALTSSNQAHPMAAEADGRARESALRLNRAVARRALKGEPYRYLAAPAIGNGLGTSDVELTAFDALSRQEITATEELAQAMWARFRGVGRSLVKDGKPLQGEAENLAELRSRAAEILERKVPVWRQLGVLPA